MLAAYRVEMTESEVGWGQRPDGYIYSISKEKLEARLKEIDAAKDYEEYSFPSSPIVIVEITQEFHDFLELGDKDPYWTPVGKHAGDLTRK